MGVNAGLEGAAVACVWGFDNAHGLFESPTNQINLKGTSGNLIFAMIARHFRAEGGNSCGINGRLSTKITQREREK